MGEAPASNHAQRGQWMALSAALLGWMFDGFEMGLFPLVARPALRDLLGTGATDGQVGLWFGVATAGFLVGAATGGVLFGWLGDRIGRVRAMTVSILTYAIFSGMCGLAQDPVQITILRFISALGMGGEWSLGVALVMEIWPDKSRALLAGLIGAAANVGYLLVGALSLALGRVIGELRDLLLSSGMREDWVQTLVANDGWRIMMMTGALPALLTFFIRLFVPESAKWEEEQKRGTTSHWATRDLLGVLLGAAAACIIIWLWAAEIGTIPLAVRIVGSLVALVVVTLGYLYPVMSYLRRSESAARAPHSETGDETPAVNAPAVPSLGPTVRRMLLGAALGSVALLGTWASIQWVPAWADQLTGGLKPEAKAYTQIASSIGAIIGTVLAALAGNWLGRRLTYCLLCVGSLSAALFLFRFHVQFDYRFLFATLLAGAFTAAFYGWLPLYLPELFPTRIRATGQGFSFNFGRIVAAVGALQGGFLLKTQFNGDYPSMCSIMSLIYLVGAAIIWFAPETKGQPLPE
ncbi:MAG: MFS transporter [Planctomycetia bacterium]|nr:MFS transporter [Planctomycetia bacterium]